MCLILTSDRVTSVKTRELQTAKQMLLRLQAVTLYSMLTQFINLQQYAAHVHRE